MPARSLNDRDPRTEGVGYLASLQAGRATAALLVVLFHASTAIFVLPKYWGVDPASSLFDFGHAGVEFFFVLSGFIIAHVHWRDVGSFSAAPAYAWKRFVRIYPLYWIVLAAILVAYVCVPSFGKVTQREPVTVLSSLVLVYWDERLVTSLSVAWTLYHEVLFYAVFLLVIINRRIGQLCLALWLGLSVLYIFQRNPLLGGYLFAPIHFLFGMGIATCWWLKKRTVPLPALFACAGTAVFILVGVDEDYAGTLSVAQRMLAYGIAASVALAGFVELERNDKLRVPKTLRVVGDASYAIYLTHFPLLSLGAKLLHGAHLHRHLPLIVLYLLLVAGVTTFGVVVHLFLERPLLRKLRRPSRPQVVHAPAV